MEICDNPVLRMLLVHNGTMTHALEALTLGKLIASVIDEKTVETSSYFNSPTIIREVVLEANGKKLVHAVSHISVDFYIEMGFGKDVPLGAIMKEKKLEQYREVYNITCDIIDDSLAQMLSIPQQPLYSRSYFVYIHSSPKIHMIETFLPDLINLPGISNNTNNS